MIPNIFVSSTISDLHYLRDGIRDAIDELAYRPVMSEYGEVGYINPSTAAESCFGSVKQCQMVVLILGRKYGMLDPEGLSVTHREYRVARENGLPIITFVEASVLSFKEVYDADPSADIWDNFKTMDNGRKTFELLDEIRNSDSYNATLPFGSVAEAKRALKRQIADFVGNKLAESVGEVNQQVRDVLAEVRTLRNVILHQGKSGGPDDQRIRQYLAATRFLLNDAAANYRHLLERLFADLDNAVEQIVTCSDLAAMVEKAEWKTEMVDEIGIDMTQPPRIATGQPGKRSIGMTVVGGKEGYEIFEHRLMRITKGMYEEFDRLQRALHAKANMS